MNVKAKDGFRLHRGSEEKLALITAWSLQYVLYQIEKKVFFQMSIGIQDTK